MERYIPFAEGEFYHIFNRGVDKRKIFFSAGDWTHFQKLLFLRNGTKHTKATRVQRGSLDTSDRGEALVDLCAYVQMENHFHLLLREKQEGGISKLMSKLLTAFSLYMNKKYDRTGPLMCRPFRAKHVDSDAYLRWLFAYIHLNPLDSFESGWREKGIRDAAGARKFLQEYRFSSYPDYFGNLRTESCILNTDALPIDTGDLEDPAQLIAEYRRMD